MPPITAPAAELKARVQREQDGPKKLRLQMRYLLASRQAQTRLDLAHLLGVQRNTIGRWLTLYAAGRLHTWLTI